MKKEILKYLDNFKDGEYHSFEAFSESHPEMQLKAFYRNITFFVNAGLIEVTGISISNNFHEPAISPTNYQPNDGALLALQAKITPKGSELINELSFKSAQVAKDVNGKNNLRA